MGILQQAAMRFKRLFFDREEIEGHLVSYNEMSSKPMDLVCFLYMPLGHDK